MGLTSVSLRGMARVFPLGLLVMVFSLAAPGCSGGVDHEVAAPVPAAALSSDWSAGREVGSKIVTDEVDGGLKCDNILRNQLIFQRGASTADRMQVVIAQIQSQQQECASDVWRPEVVDMATPAPATGIIAVGAASGQCFTAAGGFAASANAVPKVGGQNLPDSLIRKFGAANDLVSPRSTSGRDSENNIIVYWPSDVSNRPSDSASCWLYYARLGAWYENFFQSASRPYGSAVPAGTSVAAAPAATSVGTPALAPASMSSGAAAPAVESVVASPGSAEVAVRFDRVVHMRGEVWLETSGGPSANAPGGGSRVLTFGVGELSGVVEIKGVGLGLGAALRDIDGNDAALGLEPVEWRVGDGELDWGLVWGDAPAELEGFRLDTSGGQFALWAVFTRPVRFRVGDGDHRVDRLFRVGSWPGSGEHGGKSLADRAEEYLLRGRVSGLDGLEVPLKFDLDRFPMWFGLHMFPMSDVPTVADCVHHLRLNSEVDSIRLKTVVGVDPALLTEEERSEWRTFFSSAGGGHLLAPCLAFWSEEIDLENADRRNRSAEAPCLRSLRNSRNIGSEHSSFWNRDGVEFVRELLERPYLSLSDVERHILRQMLEYSSCRRYYPQLFTGRWAPFVIGE